MYITRTNLNEGIHIAGVKCDCCKKEITSENYDSLSGWTYKKNEQICPDCVVCCKSCKEKYSDDFAKDYFINGNCEDCSDN